LQKKEVFASNGMCSPEENKRLRWEHPIMSIVADRISVRVFL